MQGTHTVVRGVRAWASPWWAFAAFVALSWYLLLRYHQTDHAGNGGFGVALAMWSLMVVTMMAPTAVPALAVLREVLAGRHTARWWMFLAAYLAVWWGFSVLAATAQWLLADAVLLDAHGRLGRLPAAVALLLAGAYQFSSLKERCQTACAMPFQWFLRHWRDGARGALRMGLHHGVTCVGCCWALMLLAFVGGVGSLWVMAVMTVLMIVEKLPALGRRVTVPLGVALVCAGVLLIAVPAGGTPAHHGAGHMIEGKDPT